MAYESLFNYMSKEHGLNLLQEEMQEIERMVKLDEQQSNCNKPHVIKPLPSYDDFVKIAEQMETYMGDTYHVIKLDDVKMLFGINDD